MSTENSEKIAPLVGFRVRQARAAFGFDQQADFGAFLGGVPRSTIGYVERGQGLPNAKMLIGLIERCGLSLNWLFTGKGDMFVSDLPRLAREAGIVGARHDPDFNRAVKARRAAQEAEANAAAKAAPWRVGEVYEAGFRVIPREDVPPGPRPADLVPVLGRIAAGAGADILEAVQYAPGDADAYLIYKGAPEGAVAVQVVGASMEPDFREGDLVVVDAGRSAESGVVCVIQRSGDAEVARLKRLRRVGRRLVLESSNPAFPPEDLPRPDFVAARPVLAHLPLSRRTKG